MHQWPDGIREYILDRFGPAPEVHQLGGMSNAAVVRIEGRGRSAVLKRSLSPVETHIYVAVSGPLRANGVRLPELYVSFQEDNTYWLLLEDIRHPFPRQRWEADVEQLEMLRRLHELASDAVDLPSDVYKPEWQPAMTERALSLFAPDVAARLNEVLPTIRAATLTLFESGCLISGDPNPANWGLWNDGTLVLYDWERCTRGAAAIDLAITVPGLGTRATFEKIAAIYSGFAPGIDPRQLASDIASAKVWSVVEFLASYAQGSIVPTFSIETLLEDIPEWLRHVDPSSGAIMNES